MDNYFNMERVKQAHGLCETIRQYNLTIREYNLHREAGEPKKPELGSTELALLMILARKFGRIDEIDGKRVAVGIANGCRASLMTLEQESLLERKAIGKSLGKLIDAGFITQTYERGLVGELTKEGERRKALGLSLDCPGKNNYQRKSIGAPRKDGSGNDRWKHCAYHLVRAVWDSVVFETRGEQAPPVVTVSTEEQQAANSIDNLPAAKKPVPHTTTTVSKSDADVVFEWIKYYFEQHQTIADQSEKDARRSMHAACVELAQRALDLGDLNYANRFLFWVGQRRREVVDKLMAKTKKLGSKFGLSKAIADLWYEFVLECDDKIFDQDGNPDGAPTIEEQIESEPVQAPVVKTKAAAPIFEFDDEDEAPAQGVKSEPPANPFKYQRDAFAQALLKETNLLRRPSEGFTINLDSQQDMLLGRVGKWLDRVPYGRQIVHQRVSQSILRVEIKWNVARYIVEHVEQFVEDGFVDERYQPVIDPEVQAEMEAERLAAEELERELVRRKREADEAAELQRKKDAEFAQAARKQKLREWNCRRLLIESTDEDRGTFNYIGLKPNDIPIVRDYLTTNLPNTVTITYESDSMLAGTVSSSLIAAWKADPVGFRDNGYVETEADREAAPVAA